MLTATHCPHCNQPIEPTQDEHTGDLFDGMTIDMLDAIDAKAKPDHHEHNTSAEARH